MENKKIEFDVLVCGEINPDLILYGDVEPVFGQVEKLIENSIITIGSSSAIFACGAAHLGLTVAFIGKCGDDVFGKFMIEKMKGCGIDTRYVIVEPNQSTGFSIILNKGSDRAILTYPGLISSLEVEDINDCILFSARHLHVASYFLQKKLQRGLVSLFKKAKLNNMTVSLDTNWDPQETWAGVNKLLPFVNIFFPNEKEACSITGQRDINKAIDQLATLVDILAIKMGEQGASVIRNRNKISSESLAVPVKDTIGAGDNFDAGFVYGFLNNWSLQKSLRLGIVCGSLSTQQFGGTDGQPSLDDAMVYLTNSM